MMTKIDINNYESYFLRYIEERLSAEEREEVELFLIQHPELQEMMDLYDPDFTIAKDVDLVFVDKDLLPHAKPAKVLPMWVKYSSVAAVALLMLLIGGFWLQNGNISDIVFLTQNAEKEDSILIKNVTDMPMLLAQNDNKPAALQKENIAVKAINNANNAEVVSKSMAENDTMPEVEVTDLSDILPIEDNNSNIVYFAENVANDIHQEVIEETNETVVVEIYSNCLTEIGSGSMVQIADVTIENTEKELDEESVVIEEYSYALAEYEVDIHSDYHYTTNRYDEELAEYAIMDRWGKTKEMFSQFAEMTSTLFRYRREKTEGELIEFASILVAGYKEAKEKINYYITENVNKYIVKSEEI